MKKDRQQFYRDPIDVRNRIHALRSIGATFKVHQTNYTTTIVFPDDSKELYLTTLRSLNVFKANKLIQKEAVPQYIEADFEGRCEYYDINSEKVMELRLSRAQVYNIDLKAAYPSILRGYGLISDKTYRILLKMDKLDRLASIGMFASRKTIFTIKNGHFMNVTEEQGDYKNIFFLPAYVTDEIMKGCREIIGYNDFIFYWFDGIYFTNRNKVKEVSEWIRKNYNIDLREVFLEDFRAEDEGDIIKIEFKERSKGKKTFSLPKKETIRNHKSIIASSLIN
jgi:hypothetical protein